MKNPDPPSRAGAPLRLAGLVQDSIVDGPGLRFAVFAQGCPHRCEGCHNAATWHPAGGYAATVGDVLAKIRARREWLDGVTLSGGEPFAQAPALAALARGCRELGLHVTGYSGYTWETLTDPATAPPGARDLLAELDLLVDGPFVLARRSLSLRFRGSDNQRVIDVPASLRAGRAVVTEFPPPVTAAHLAPADPWTLR